MLDFISFTELMELINKLYGAYYFNDKSAVHESGEEDLYSYKLFFGNSQIHLEKGDSLYYLSEDKGYMHLEQGEKNIESKHFAVSIRGYTNGVKMSSIGSTNLPYVNGCSTREILPPERIGDPTAQLLKIPPFSSEQAHHIHSTVRVAYILEGQGYSIVGMEGKNTKTELIPGMCVVLEKFSPHHFETGSKGLTVIPIHVFSSPGAVENSHPMFNGTHMI